MVFGHIIKTAAKGVSRNKSRSALTILGIVIGITSIMMIMSLGSGAKSLILGQIQGQMGSRVIELRPGRQPKGPTDILAIFSDSLKEKDLEELKKKSNLPHVSGIMPLVFSSASAVYGNETYRSTLYGMNELAPRMYNVVVSDGRFLSDEDVKGFADVAVIGSKVKEELFGTERDVLGKKIKIKGRNLRIIGVLPQKGQGFAFFDDSIIVPYTTAQRYILGIKYFQHIIIEADTEENVERTLEDITFTMRNSHNITDPEKDDFSMTSQADAIKMLDSVMTILTLFLTAVAAISLVVGGVGIMNIMLVSVTERTREIGLRKALGATERDILLQFMIEAVMLTSIGGIIGIIFGTSLSYITSIILSNFVGLGWEFTFPLFASFLGIGVSGIVGLVFGLYPARQASLKSPIESLRYE
ncbi:MAG TPA: ABC transporter permease [Candidatus Paceibacterota bacterium]|nr:ABC transporter permease [Candidatus Paceibacterota bacterium]